jgi:putative ABC transport system permease protein
MFTTVVATFPTGTSQVSAQVVDPDYAEMHRIVPVLGRWFTDTDADLYAPAVVVNRTMLEALGPRDPALPPTVLLGGATPVRATVIGVLDDPGFERQLFLLPSAHARWAAGAVDAGASPPSLEVWVPEGDADAVLQAVQSDLMAVFGADAVSVFRSDAAGELQVLDLVLTYGVRIVGGFALLLGGVGVLNVGLVTVRQRIREIGVRRSFGATSARVFATVLLESVCATAAAGALAVALSVALVENIPFDTLLGDDLTLTEVPPFPVRAAVEGFAAATAVGALAGFLPALIAVRSKVIDAIRY